MGGGVRCGPGPPAPGFPGAQSTADVTVERASQSTGTRGLSWTGLSLCSHKCARSRVSEESVDSDRPCFHIHSGPWAHLKGSKITDTHMWRSLWEVLWGYPIWILKFSACFVITEVYPPLFPDWFSVLPWVWHLSDMQPCATLGCVFTGKPPQGRDGMWNRPEERVQRLWV